MQTDSSTEEKIKNAARIVFQKKGFAATRTRDIADESGINLALLNYYFRSKQKLFEIIMLETLQKFFQSMSNVLNDNTITFEKKIEKFTGNYVELLIQQPDIPFFIINELRTNPQGIPEKIRIKELLFNSHFERQYQQAIQDKKIPDVHILHFVMNIVGLTVFPFIGRQIIEVIGGINTDEFNSLMLERKTLIPQWLQAMSAVK